MFFGMWQNGEFIVGINYCCQFPWNIVGTSIFSQKPEASMIGVFTGGFFQQGSV